MADRIAQQLIESNFSVVRLDGDLTRLVLGWSELTSETDRRNVAQKYVRLAQVFSAQGHVVVVSVVGLYPETFAALEASKERFMVFFLDVSSNELARRNIHQSLSRIEQAMPVNSAEALPSYAVHVRNQDRSISKSGDEIIQVVRSKGLLSPMERSAFNTQQFIQDQARSLISRRSHWDNYYSRPAKLPHGPSSFARFVVSRLRENDGMKFLDFGCGNGRDSLHLATIGTVLGVDSSTVAVRSSAELAWARGVTDVAFAVVDEDGIGPLILHFLPNVIYSRFVLHSMTQMEQAAFIRDVSASVQWNACMFLECRATDDQLQKRV